jgi:hypothetical protein
MPSMILFKDSKFVLAKYFFLGECTYDGFVFGLGFVNNIIFCSFYFYCALFTLVKTKLTHHK